ncbi:MAG TPA: ATP-binding protein [Haliangium sp.]|nr:ATP-binding protein [Haliangium sp.]
MTARTAPDGLAETLRRRVVYLMLFRLVLISLVLGSTLVLWWLSDVDLATPSSMVVYAIIGTTYLLTIVYALAVNRTVDLARLANIQLAIDLVTSALLMHVTGGAQSAYTFFFPLAIIAAAIVHFRTGAVVVAGAAALLYSAVALLGWLQLLPVPQGQAVLPWDATGLELGRAMALHLAACAGVAVLASNLASQIQQTSASLASQRDVTANLYALHEDIVRSLSTGLLTVNPNGAVLTVNQAASDILGVPADELIGRRLAAIMPGIEHALAEVGAQHVAQRRDMVRTRPSGVEQVLAVSVSQLRSNRDQVIGGVVNFQDLTEMRVMERQVRRAERLAVVGTLAAGVAHEIRNPLASISGSIELLRATPQVDEDGRALMDIVTREVDRLDALITDLLDYTNPQPRALVAFDLASLARETVQVFVQDRSFEAVQVTCGGLTALEIVADPSRVRQVLWNLLRNAAEAARSRLSVRVERRDAMAVLEVSDDGPGIEPEHLDRVFDPFFTTKSQGSGLGLATCHSIVREHGGSIHVENEPGGGCRFVVALPLQT